MDKQAPKRELLGMIMLDQTELELHLQVFSVTRPDGSKGVAPIPYARNPATGKMAPHKPGQPLQVPVYIAADVFARLAEIARTAEGAERCPSPSP